MSTLRAVQLKAANRTRPKNTIDWDHCDWAKSDTALAEEIGRSRERVRQMRQVLGKPASKDKHKPRHSVANDFSRWAEANRQRLDDLTLDLLQALVRQQFPKLSRPWPVSLYSALKLRHLPCQQARHWLMDFDLNDQWLGRTWRNARVGRIRWHFQTGPARWNLQASGPGSSKPLRGNFGLACARQTALARRYFDCRRRKDWWGLAELVQQHENQRIKPGRCRNRT